MDRPTRQIKNKTKYTDHPSNCVLHRMGAKLRERWTTWPAGFVAVFTIRTDGGSGELGLEGNKPELPEP